jgi:hypothetical protein
MIRRVLGVTVRRPVPEAFAFAADLSDLPRWQTGIVASTLSSGAPGIADSTYRVTFKPPLVPAKHYTYHVTAYSEDEAFSGAGSFGPIPFRETFRFRAVPGGTRITQTVEMELHGATVLLSPLVRLAAVPLMQGDLRRLGRIIERRAGSRRAAGE